MLHDDRLWCLGELESIEKLVAELSAITWCPCQAFRVTGVPDYLWLNDSTSPDGAQEFAVVRIDDQTGAMTQVESLTVSWMDGDELLASIQATLRSEHDPADGWGRPVAPKIQFPKEHGRCQHCA